MNQRRRDETVTFRHPFLLAGVDRPLPAGAYRVTTDEELVEGLSFSVYRRVSTLIFVPTPSRLAHSLEMAAIDPRDLEAALQRDAAASLREGG